MDKEVPGTDLLKRRVRLTFDFDITCNDGPILNSISSDKEYDIALLKSFLTTERLAYLMVDCAATELGLNSLLTFMETYFPDIDTYAHYLFGQAINQLKGKEREYWIEARDDDQDLPWGDVLSLSTEKLYECFKADFVESTFQIVEA